MEQYTYERLYDLVFGNDVSEKSSGDYLITKDSIKIDLLGAKKENISVDVSGDVIEVTSTKKSIRGENLKYNKKFYISKEYDPKSITAKYEEGILEISLKLKKENEPIKVKIE